MRYKLKKETKPTLSTFGRYKAVACHPETIDTNRIVKELCRQEGITEGTAYTVLIGLSKVVRRHLRQGNSVRLDHWGLMKLEIESDTVDSPDVFNPREHIRGLRLHFLPESSKGKPELYQGVELVHD